MSEYLRLRAAPAAVRSSSNGGPHIGLESFDTADVVAALDAVAPSTPAPAELAAIAITKNYHKGPVEIPVLAGVDLELRGGEFLAIIGQSGS
ncbi:MAG TPA: hypothetical protein VG056_09680, partial [Pirellulales bacterium]|nr:hypothetical protein [Pirellulales bacterium]